MAVLAMSVSSCGEVCVRCENGSIPDVETKCFADDGERDEYALSKELQGYTCNDQ